MSKNRNYGFVLWADQFDAAVVAIFVGELSAAGLRVKVVGLTARQTRDTHGLALTPELTLGQALALTPGASYVVIPCAPPGLKRLKNDPRLLQFFQQAHASGATFMIGEPASKDIVDLALFPIGANILIYPEREKLVQFIRELVKDS